MNSQTVEHLLQGKYQCTFLLVLEIYEARVVMPLSSGSKNYFISLVERDITIPLQFNDDSKSLDAKIVSKVWD